MRRRTLILLGFFAMAANGAWASSGESWLLVGARVLAPDGERWLDGAAVLLSEGRIAGIGRPEELAVPAEARRLELGGLALLPGLIDLHTHLLLHPYDETPWDDQVLREPLELRTIRGVLAARWTLEAGFTTIRDLGTEGAGFADVALRDAVTMGWIAGPRVLTTTRAIIAASTYAPKGFDPRWTIPQGAQEVNGADEMRRAVREQVAAGADWIKVYADSPRRPGAPPTATLSRQELEAAVEEARSAGIEVVAHAARDEGIRRAVEAGAATIEHGYEASEAVLALLRERGVVLCPTLAASEAVARYAGWKPGQPEPVEVRRGRELMARSLHVGVRIGCGSDAGVFAHGENARELELMVAYGMSPAAAIRAATATAAEVIGREGDLGRIARGHVADLIAVRGDPLADISALRSPIVVIQEGRLALDRR